MSSTPFGVRHFGVNMKVAVGSDHAGFQLKQHVVTWLKERGHQVHDAGCFSAERADYPDFAHKVAGEVAGGRAERGVLVCGSGIGMAIAANRHAGVRAANCILGHQVEMTRRHNDANVLCLGERMVSPVLAETMLGLFFDTDFEQGRHSGRIAKIEERDGANADVESSA